MTVVQIENGDEPPVQVDLKNPYVAALLGWLWPGGGHVYQGRYTKALIFMVCILGLFFSGLALSRGRCVYFSTEKNDFRWQYLMQAGAGLVAMPALAQHLVVGDGGRPMWVIAERYPKMPPPHQALSFKIIEETDGVPQPEVFWQDGFMARPAGEIDLDHLDVLGAWHRESGYLFDVGTLFTLVAGLLNLLAVYDAFAGPAVFKKTHANDEAGND